MILLIATLGIFLVLLLLDAWILTWVARLLKSARGRFTWGLLAVALIGAFGIIDFLVASQLAVKTPASPGITLLTGALSAVVNLGVLYVILKRVFTLSAGRAFALFGVYLLWDFAQLALAFAVFRPFIAEAFVIPTASMSPTLIPGDRLLTNKLEHPRRWDLVLYHPPLPNGMVSGEVYCKRLVGLPGERLRFEGGNLYVNDRLVAPPPVVAGRYTLDHLGSHYHDGQTITLAPDQLFLLGDNIQKSYDSRFVGPSKQSSVVGVADLRYWPLGRLEVLR